MLLQADHQVSEGMEKEETEVAANLEEPEGEQDITVSV